LPDAYGGGEVVDGVYVLQRLPSRYAVAYISSDQLDIWAEIWGALSVSSVNLRREVVQRSNVVTSAEQFVGEV